MNVKAHTTRSLVVAAIGESTFFAFGLALPWMAWRAAADLDDFLNWVFTFDPWISGVRAVIFIVLGLLAGVVFALAFRFLYFRDHENRAEQGWGARSVFVEVLRHSRPLRMLAMVALIGYFTTWAFGVPAAITDMTRMDVDHAKATAERQHEPFRPVYPATTFGIPLLPGLVLVRHHHAGGLHGWGGWKVYLWYVSGQKLLVELPRWVE